MEGSQASVHFRCRRRSITSEQPEAVEASRVRRLTGDGFGGAFDLVGAEGSTATTEGTTMIHVAALEARVWEALGLFVETVQPTVLLTDVDRLCKQSCHRPRS